MCLFTWKYPFLNDDVTSISTGDITVDLLTAYQKAAYVHYIVTNWVKWLFVPLRRFDLKTFPSMNKNNICIDNNVITLLEIYQNLVGKMYVIGQKQKLQYEIDDKE